jgi:hypothetical protein
LIFGLAATIFFLAAGFQYTLYRVLLQPALEEGDVEARRRGLLRWLAFAGGFQALVVIAVVGWGWWLASAGARGWAWAPPLALLLGTGLPLQLAAMRVLRAAARG